MNSSLSSRFAERVDAIALEHEVADRRLAEQIALAQLLQLAVSRQREEQLRLKRRAAAAGVEIGEKRILGVVAHDGGVEPRAEPFGQRGLAQTRWSLDGEVAKVHARKRYHTRMRIAGRYRVSLWAISGFALMLRAACASRPPAAPPPVAVAPPAPVIPIERKAAWILRLEQQRTLERSGGRRRSAGALRLTPMPASAARAVVAIGRVGMQEGAAALVDGARRR